MLFEEAADTHLQPILRGGEIQIKTKWSKIKIKNYKSIFSNKNWKLKRQLTLTCKASWGGNPDQVKPNEAQNHQPFDKIPELKPFEEAFETHMQGELTGHPERGEIQTKWSKVES